MHTLCIDIGGTGVKTLVLDQAGVPVNERRRERTPQPAPPAEVYALIERMVGDQPHYDRVSVGFPGIVKKGVTFNAPNLGNEHWQRVSIAADLEARLQRPVRVINDADLQGIGVVSGHGAEMVLTLGTGLGAAIFCEGQLYPNLELGHQQYNAHGTYEDWIADVVLKQIGVEAWSARVEEVLTQLQAIWNYDRLYLGGGNLRHLQFQLPANAETFTPEQGLRGGVRLWAS